MRGVLKSLFLRSIVAVFVLVIGFAQAVHASEPGAPFTREQLIRHLWESDFVGDRRAIDVHVSNLRRKIEPNPEAPRYLTSLRGLGYRFDG